MRGIVRVVEKGRSQFETRVHPQPAMRKTEPLRTRRLTARLNKTAAPVPASSRQAEELMELAVDAAQSRQLPEFLERFAGRAARMLGAAWGGVAGCGGRVTERSGNGPTLDGGAYRFKSWIITSSREHR